MKQIIQSTSQKSVNPAHFKFKLAFHGLERNEGIEASAFANVILETTHILYLISIIKFGKERARQVKFHLNAFSPETYEAEFLIQSESLLPLFPQVFSALTLGKDIYDLLTNFLEIKKSLQGTKPQFHFQDEGVTLITPAGQNIVLSNVQHLILMNRSINKAAERLAKPLDSDQTGILNINFYSPSSRCAILHHDREYFRFDDIQEVKNFRLRGVVSKIDAKTKTGFITLHDNGYLKRVGFEYTEDLISDEYVLLCDSLKNKAPVFITGPAEVDFTDQPKKIHVLQAHTDPKLF